MTSPIYADTLMLCSTIYRYHIQNFLNAVQKISTKLSGGYFSDTLLGPERLRPPPECSANCFRQEAVVASTAISNAHSAICRHGGFTTAPDARRRQQAKQSQAIPAGLPRRRDGISRNPTAAPPGRLPRSERKPVLPPWTGRRMDESSPGNDPPRRLAEESLETLKRKRPIETPEAPNVPQSESNRRRGLGQSKTC